MKEEIIRKLKNKNLIVKGSVLSGKTTNIMFPIVGNIINKKENLFILDCKEEYLNKYYSLLKENNYNIIILNLRDLEKSNNWNPLDYPYQLYKEGYKDKAQEYLEKISKELYNDKDLDSFWSNNASSVFTGVCLSLFEDAKENEINLNSVYNVLNMEGNGIDYLTEYFNMKDKTSSAYICASTTVMSPRDTKGGILSTAKEKLGTYVSREILSKFLSKTTINMNDLVDKKSAIIFVARDEDKSLNTLATIFIKELYAILINNHNKNKYHFILDNFDSINMSKELDDMFSSCLSRNIKFYVVVRNLGFIKNNYKDDLFSLSNTIDIKEDTIDILNNNVVVDSVDKDFKTIIIEDNKNIDYPKLSMNKVNIFDVKKFIGKDNDNIKKDEIVKKIDDEIKKLQSLLNKK